MKRITSLILAMAGGLILWAAWPVSPLTLLIFIAWIPLLWIELRVTSKRYFFGLTYLTMLIWNVGTTWWIWNASDIGALMAFFANSFLMCFPWLGFKIIRKKFGENTGYLSLVSFWMCFEFIHLQDWGLSWPWLTQGNVFANHPGWVQWYEYTGTSGGTLWVMTVNILFFIFIKYNFILKTQKTYKHIVAAVPILLVPILFSWVDGLHKKGPGRNTNIVIIQPNIDPYEKISPGTTAAQLNKLIQLSEQAIDSNTALVIWPETALYTGGGIEEKTMRQNNFLNPLWDLLQHHPKINLFTGIESFEIYDSKKTSTARQGQGFYYDAFNGSVLLDSSGPLAFYHKSMLVPGVETLPWFLKFIDQWFEKFGGTTAGYAKQKNRTVLNANGGYKIAPAICYESIYGEYMSDYISNGANLICVITNDGWWGNTPGHKQHMNYARLRAIETRTWVARSANTGISCFIDPFGKVFDAQPWDKAAAIKREVPAAHTETFFVKHGDILSRVTVLLSILFISLTLVLWIIKKFFNKNKESKTLLK